MERSSNRKNVVEKNRTKGVARTAEGGEAYTDLLKLQKKQF